MPFAVAPGPSTMVSTADARSGVTTMPDCTLNALPGCRAWTSYAVPGVSAASVNRPFSSVFVSSVGVGNESALDTIARAKPCEASYPPPT